MIVGQGDPLSPYLFVLVMEAFSQMIENAVIGGFLTTYHVGGRAGKGVEVSHLLFVGDMLIFCKASQNQLTFLCWLLMRFEALSDLKINLEKSELIPMGRVSNVDPFADELGCKVGSLPTTYLSLPLGAHCKSVAVWDGLEECFRKRLASWKRLHISFFYRQGQKNSINTKKSHLDPKSIQGIYKREPKTYKERRANKKTYQL